MEIGLTIDKKVRALTRNFSHLKLGKMTMQPERGSTLVEVAVAGALLALALMSLYALYGSSVKETKAGDTAAIAEQNSIARIDQMLRSTSA